MTARLSKKFYDRLGDDIANELVDWFNAVDLTYQTQLREMNDLNWRRFESLLLAESAAIKSELRGEFRSGLADLRSELLKWMFIYWTGSVVTLGGLMLALR